jgi:hypothetical protein
MADRSALTRRCPVCSHARPAGEPCPRCTATRPLAWRSRARLAWHRHRHDHDMRAARRALTVTRRVRAWRTFARACRRGVHPGEALLCVACALSVGLMLGLGAALVLVTGGPR